MGKDDFGLEMDFRGNDEENLMKFHEWERDIYNILEPCTQDDFIKLGFKKA